MKTLRAWRLDRLLSIRQLAEASGVTAKTIVDIEHGRRQAQYATMRELSTALGVGATDVEEFAITLGERSKNAA